MWLKKLETVSAELMKSALSGVRGKSAKDFSGLPWRAAAAWPCPSLPPFFGFVIGHSPEYRGPPGIVPNGYAAYKALRRG